MEVSDKYLKVILEKLLPDKDWALHSEVSDQNTIVLHLVYGDGMDSGMYYYMNGRRKMNVGSSMPTFMLDYERGIKGVFKSTVLANVGSLIYSKT